MNDREPLKRRNLAAAFSAAPSLPEETVSAIAAQNGFAVSALPTPQPVANDDSNGLRRRNRLPTGRDHQFNVRLRKDTLDYIYAQANARNIPIAQVIEEATEALKLQAAVK